MGDVDEYVVCIEFGCGATCCGQLLFCPRGRDTDEDGLDDCWELLGYDADSDGIVDVNLPAMGANPWHKDIFVEVDWMAAGPRETQSHAFKPEAQALAVAMFAAAPVSNPDGTTGINLHIDAGQGGLFTGGDEVPHESALALEGSPPYTWAVFQSIKNGHFANARAGVFHYCLSAHELVVDGKSCGGVSRGITGVNGIRAADFVIALAPHPSNPGTSSLQAITFAHELGHNLGLWHGGFENENHKPNYLSIMNYSFSYEGLIVNNNDGVLDYSRFLLPTLWEDNLFESQGLSGPSEIDHYSTIYFCKPVSKCDRKESPANTSIDWNCDGSISPDAVASEINSVDCSGFRTFLSSFNDWGSIRFDGVGIPNPTQVQISGEPPDVTNMPWAEYFTFAAFHGDLDNNKVFDVFDVVALIDYVFSGAQPPDPIYRASVDCQAAQTDVFDVIYLIDYVFAGGPYPCF